MLEPVKIREGSRNREKSLVNPVWLRAMDWIGIEFGDTWREVVKWNPGSACPGSFWMIWKKLF